MLKVTYAYWYTCDYPGCKEGKVYYSDSSVTHPSDVGFVMDDGGYDFCCEAHRGGYAEAIAQKEAPDD